jgi:hypothetical protein
MMVTTQDELTKTIAWMRRERVQGTDEEITRYAADWLRIRNEYTVSLDLKRQVDGTARLTDTRSMEREAARIARERTRHRVIGGFHVYYQVRVNAYGEPNVGIYLVEGDGSPDTDGWEEVPAGRIPHQQGWPPVGPRIIRSAWLYLPVVREWDAEARNNIGDMGTSVIVWPSQEEIGKFVDHQIRDWLRWPDRDGEDPEMTPREIVRAFNLSPAYTRMLQRLAGTEKLPARKPGRDWLIRRSAVEHWLATNPGPGRPRKHAEHP